MNVAAIDFQGQKELRIRIAGLFQPWEFWEWFSEAHPERAARENRRFGVYVPRTTMWDGVAPEGGWTND